MRAVVMRVKHASVTIDGRVNGAIGQGLLILLGVAPTDTLASLYVFTAVIALFEVVTVILLIASVETSLRKRFVPKTAA
mgnify:CR=1 FL=1